MTDAPPAAATLGAASIAVAVLIAVAAGTFVINEQGTSPADPSNAVVSVSSLPSVDHPHNGAGAAVIHRLETAVRTGDRAGFLALTEPGNKLGRTRLRHVFANLQRLEVTDFAARYLGEGVGRTNQGDDEWVASVDMSWRLSGFDTRPVTQQSSLTLATHDGRTYLERIALPGDNRWPVWALGSLTVLRRHGAVAVAVGKERARTTLIGAARAIHDVRRVIGSFDDPLLVIAPATPRQFDRLVGVSTGPYPSIAAVTTTADGSLRPHSLMTVDLNPTAFDRLGPAAAQVVLSHETTHAVTQAVTTSLPAWLEEGFADYVALRDTGLPPRVISRGLLGHVRGHGAPVQLPTQHAFQAGTLRLDRAYEASWLACEMIARRYGQDALVRLYERAGKTGARAATYRVLRIGPEALTRDWQRYLEGLAGG